jgi:hypothetical protein
MKWLLESRTRLIYTSVVIILTVLLLLYLSAEPLLEYQVDIILNSLPPGLDYGSIELQPLSFQVGMTDVRFERNGKRLMAVDRVNVRPSLSLFLTGSLSFSSLTIHDSRIIMDQGPRREILRSLLENRSTSGSSGANSSFRISVGEIYFDNASMKYFVPNEQEDTTPVHADINGVLHSVNVNSDNQSANIDLNTSFNNRPGTVALRGDLRLSRNELDWVDGRYQVKNLNINGTLSKLLDSFTSIDLRGTITSSALVYLEERTFQVSEFDFHSSFLTFSSDRIDVVPNYHSRDLQFQFQKASTTLSDHFMPESLSFADGRVSFGHLRVTAVEGPLSRLNTRYLRTSIDQAEFQGARGRKTLNTTGFEMESNSLDLRTARRLGTTFPQLKRLQLDSHDQHLDNATISFTPNKEGGLSPREVEMNDYSVSVARFSTAEGRVDSRFPEALKVDRGKITSNGSNVKFSAEKRSLNEVSIDSTTIRVSGLSGRYHPRENNSKKQKEDSGNEIGVFKNLPDQTELDHLNFSLTDSKLEYQPDDRPLPVVIASYSTTIDDWKHRVSPAPIQSNLSVDTPTFQGTLTGSLSTSRPGRPRVRDLKSDFQVSELSSFNSYLGKRLPARIQSGSVPTGTVDGTFDPQKLDLNVDVSLQDVSLAEKQYSDPTFLGISANDLIAVFSNTSGIIQLSVDVTGTLSNPEHDLKSAIAQAVPGALGRRIMESGKTVYQSETVQSAEETGREVGQGTAEYVSDTAAETGESIGQEVAETGEDIGSQAAEAGEEIGSWFTGDSSDSSENGPGN